MKVIAILAAFACALSECGYVKDWEGSNDAGRLQAKFQDLIGTQKLTLNIRASDHLLNYHFIITQGNLSVQLRSSSRKLIDTTISPGEIRDSLKVDEPADKSLRLIIHGSHTSGSIDFIFNKQ